MLALRTSSVTVILLRSCFSFTISAKAVRMASFVFKDELLRFFTFIISTVPFKASISAQYFAFCT